jgi:polyisoprenoid-binding protein YceI
MNILIKLMSIVALVIGPALHQLYPPQAGGLAATANEVNVAGIDQVSLNDASSQPSKQITGLTGAWKVDGSHSFVDFSIRHILSEAKGSFNRVSGTAQLSDDPAACNFNISIDVNSINTSNTDRDNHLKSPDFFDAGTNPTINLVADKLELQKDGSYIASGKLTLKGKTKDVKVPISYLGMEQMDDGEGKKMKVAAFKGSFVVKRSEFGIGEAGGVVGDDVKVNFSAELNQ